MIYDITRVRYSKRQACNLIGGSRVPGEFFFFVIVLVNLFTNSRGSRFPGRGLGSDRWQPERKIHVEGGDTLGCLIEMTKRSQIYSRILQSGIRMSG